MKTTGKTHIFLETSQCHNACTPPGVRDNTASQVVFSFCNLVVTLFVLPPERHKVKQGAKAFQQRVKNQLFLLLLDRQLCKAAPWEPRMKYKDLKIAEMLIF